MKRLLFLSFLIISILFNSNAQSDEEAVKQTILRMFDGMRAGDAAMVSSVFAKGIIMQRVTENKEGETIIRTSDPKRFLTAVGTPHDQVWDERIAYGPIQIDGDMASAWIPYQFFLGNQFSHCGVNSFQLYKSEEGWKIHFLVDTGRKEDCPEVE